MYSLFRTKNRVLDLLLKKKKKRNPTNSRQAMVKTSPGPASGCRLTHVSRRSKNDKKKSKEGNTVESPSNTRCIQKKGKDCLYVSKFSPVWNCSAISYVNGFETDKITETWSSHFMRLVPTRSQNQRKKYRRKESWPRFTCKCKNPK